MKKGKIIIATVLAATMLIGAGYSAWTSNVNLIHNVTTGSMNVEFVTPQGSKYLDLKEVAGSPYVKPSITSRDTKKINFSLDNLYPGASYRTITEEKNTGTIGVKFDSAAVTYVGTPDEALKNNMTVSYGCYLVKDGRFPTLVSGKYNVPLAKLADTITTDLTNRNVVLEPGESLQFRGPNLNQSNFQRPTDSEKADLGQDMTFTLNDSSAFVKDEHQKSNLSFDIQLNWKQFNK